MDRTEQRRITEALILASSEPISATRLASAIPHVTAAKARELVGELCEEYASSGRAFEIVEASGGYQIRTRPEYANYVRQLDPERRVRLSQAALETLAIVAYKQPATRAEVEHIRGVDVGAVLRSLLERKLVRIAGHREVPGRPILYGTSRRFLEVFGLPRLEDLPALRDLEELARAAGIETEDDGDASLQPDEPAREETDAAVPPVGVVAAEAPVPGPAGEPH